MTTPQQSQLLINTKYHWLSFMLAAFSPRAIINGHEIKLTWGDNFIPAPPGVHEITVYIQYLWKFGQATITVDNTNGAPQIFYAAPVINFIKGAIGFEPQKAPGVAATWIFTGVIFALILICCCGSFFLNQ
jgi:hypothetical protein